MFYDTVRRFDIPAEVHSVDLPHDVPHIEHPHDWRGVLARGRPETYNLGAQSHVTVESFYVFLKKFSSIRRVVHQTAKTTMITARLFGGLGNQLFIYATARALSLRNQTPLALDVESGFKHDHQFRRQFMLHHFNIQYSPAPRWNPFTQPMVSMAARILDRYFEFPRRSRFYLTDRQHGDMEEFLRVPMPPRVYLDGYWQKEKYFKEYEEQIRSELTIRTPIGQQSTEIAHAMAESDSIAVHSRRLHQARAGHGPDPTVRSLPPEYYVKAIHMIAERVKRPHLFCFSDYPEWARQNFAADLPITFVTHNAGDLRSHEDLWLMTKCKHHVIANSTFSWWGAWLCDNGQKVVISPEPSQWSQVMDIPSGWITMRDLLIPASVSGSSL